MKHPCESCGEREATVHFTEIVGGEKRELHLCEECARQKALPIQTGVSLAELLNNFLSQIQRSELDKWKHLTCEACGMTYADFQSTGRFGCPNDYEVFQQPVTELMERLQDGVEHIGKVPPSADRSLAKHNELVKLRRQLDRAVLREDYETAKTLRDHIAAYTESSDDP